MAKEHERKLAKELFVVQCKTQKEIARLTNTQEKTIGVWVKKYGWKEERDARINSSSSQIESIKTLIGKLTDKRLVLIKKMDEASSKGDTEKYDSYETKAARLADEVSKYNKTLQTLDKENKISLSVYLDVMSDIFKALQKSDMDLYMKTIDFQEEHLTTVSLKIG